MNLETLKYPVKLTEDQLELIVVALKDRFEKRLRKTAELPGGRSKNERDELAFIQETLQYVTLVTNVITNNLNEDVKESGGIKTLDSIGAAELDGTEDQSTSVS